MVGVAAVSAVTAMAGSYPFPQNMKHPHGTTIEYADTDMIKDHYNKWKKAWYDASQGWIYAPEGTCSTVSEAIAYGMLITVYMDEQSVFDKLYSTWTGHGGKGAGMDWRIGCQEDHGSATDADEDAALALVMAAKQWNNNSYLSDAQTLIKWIAQNDFDGNNSLKPGSGWSSDLNPSYVMLGHYRLFEKVTNDAKWSTLREKAAKDLLACQDSKTGLVGDWCDWTSHQPKVNGKVSNDLGFYDDASRTPWRTAWAYYWYGDSDALTFNKKITQWVIPEARTASGINSGYKYQNNTYVKDDSEKRNFVSSSFSGGIGLATSSVDSDEAKAFFGTVYKTLSSLTSCEQANGCGDNVTGEKYYPATLNVLYLLLMTGNMPNLYDISGFQKFTPDPSKAPSVSSVEGTQMEKGDSTVALSGFWNWGSYHDKLGIGTKMMPDSGSSPLFYRDGALYAEASMEIGPEPEYVEALKDQLKYPSAGIAMSFRGDEKGVDLLNLGVKYLVVNQKASGPIRMAILNTVTVEAGGEPGTYVDASSDYQETTYDLTPEQGGYGYGPNGKADGKNAFTIMDWVKKSTAPNATDVLKNAKGLKWEVKDSKGGIGAISIKSIKFLDANKQPISYDKITGYVVPGDGLPKNTGNNTQGGDNQQGQQGGDNQQGQQGGDNQQGQQGQQTVDPNNPNGQGVIDPNTGVGIIATADALHVVRVTAMGMMIQVSEAKLGANYAVFSMQGKVIASGKIANSVQNIVVPNKGSYIVRVGEKIRTISIK